MAGKRTEVHFEKSISFSVFSSSHLEPLTGRSDESAGLNVQNLVAIFVIAFGIALTLDLASFL